MSSALTLFLVWIIGGITFLPAVFLSILAYLYYKSPIAIEDDLKRHIAKTETTSLPQDAKLIKAGWLTVRRTYDPLPPEGTYTSLISSGYKSFMDSRSKDPRRLKAKDSFYALLKQSSQNSVLFLYDCDPATLDSSECWGAIDCSLFDTVVYPIEPKTLDGEIWMKRTCIVLKPRDSEVLLSNSPLEGVTDSLDSKELPWFFFTKTNDEKEDWYFALLSATNPLTASMSNMFDSHDMSSLVESIDAQPDSIPTRWFNALFGRLFLSNYRTESLEAYIVNRIVRKLNRVNKPSFLSEIRVREVNVGSNAPLFNKPMLKELTPDGQASMELNVRYQGEFRITISTVATINLGARFKTYEVALVLAIVLKELEGTMLLKIKKPPSNRLWFGFTAMPKMVLSIEPVVSTRQIKWSMILKTIESRIKEILVESIVMPNLDDIAFFDSRPYTHRAGIFDESARKHEDLATADPNPAAEAEADEEISISIDQPDEEVAESGLRQRAQIARTTRSNSVGQSSSTLGIATTETAASDSSSTKQDKKKSWFSSSKNLLSSSASSLNSITHEKPETGTEAPTKSRHVPPPFEPPLESHKDKSVTRPEQSQTAETAHHETATDRLNKLLSKDMARKVSVDKPKSTDPSPVHTPEEENQEIQVPDADADALKVPTLPILESSIPVPSQRRRTMGSADVGGSPLLDSLETTTLLSTSSREPSPSRSVASLPSSPSKHPFLPPPKRVPELARNPSHTGPSPPAKENLLHTWRTKAADKQALAAGYIQAKDALMKKWGNNVWSKPKSASSSNLAEQVQEPVSNVTEDSRQAALGVGLPIASTSSSISDQEPAARPHRASISIKTGATTQLSTSTPSDTSFAYRATPQMAIPGISDQSQLAGLGPAGPMEIRPVKPGDVAEKPRIGFRWPDRGAASPRIEDQEKAATPSQQMSPPPTVIDKSRSLSSAQPSRAGTYSETDEQSNITISASSIGTDEEEKRSIPRPDQEPQLISLNNEAENPETTENLAKSQDTTEHEADEKSWGIDG